MSKYRLVYGKVCSSKHLPAARRWYGATSMRGTGRRGPSRERTKPMMVRWRLAHGALLVGASLGPARGAGSVAASGALVSEKLWACRRTSCNRPGPRGIAKRSSRGATTCERKSARKSRNARSHAFVTCLSSQLTLGHRKPECYAEANSRQPEHDGGRRPLPVRDGLLKRYGQMLTDGV